MNARWQVMLVMIGVLVVLFGGVESASAQGLRLAQLQSPAPVPTQLSSPDWVQVTDQADWQARDSQAEVVFRDRLWILGGWFDSYSAPPRDVWSSTDGKTWTLEQREAPWRHSDLSMSLVHGGRMWMMGGWYNGRLPDHSAGNEVWSSADGKAWQRETSSAGWSPRLASGLVEFRDRLWILGGTEDYYFGDARSLKNDVWSSTDGRKWQQEAPAAAWSPRAYHQAVALRDKIYVLGGGNYVPEYAANNDVWCSADGVHWECVAEHAPWAARLWFSAVAYRDHLWVLGGWSNNPSQNWSDVWYSRDGREWHELKTQHCWKARHEHSAFVFQNELWIAGGHAQPLSREVWKLRLPTDWAGSRRDSSVGGGAR